MRFSGPLRSWRDRLDKLKNNLRKNTLYGVTFDQKAILEYQRKTALIPTVQQLPTEHDQRVVVRNVRRFLDQEVIFQGKISSLTKTCWPIRNLRKLGEKPRRAILNFLCNLSGRVNFLLFLTFFLILIGLPIRYRLFYRAFSARSDNRKLMKNVLSLRKDFIKYKISFFYFYSNFIRNLKPLKEKYVLVFHR